MIPLNNIDELLIDITNKKTKILGIGCFSYGVSEYWRIVRSIIEKMAFIKKELVILIEDDYPKIANINKLIKGKDKFELGGMYDYNAMYPLKKYTDIRYDSIEFGQFIQDLKDLNRYYDIEIFGIRELLNRYSIHRQVNVSGDNKDEIYEIYPEMKKDKSKYAKFIMQNRKKFDKPNKFMADFADYIYKDKKRFMIIIGHNELLHVSKLNGYKTMGYLLRQNYGPKYKCIGTGSNEGEIRYIGEIQPIYKLYREPTTISFVDKGSLQRYLKNIHKLKDVGIYKIIDDSDLYYYTSGSFIHDVYGDNMHYYKNSKYLDYLIYFYTVSSLHNFIF